MALLDLTDDPEENIDIEEEEGVDQKKRVVDAPWPERRECSAIYVACFVMVNEVEIEENWRKWNQERNSCALQITSSTHDVFYGLLWIPTYVNTGGLNL